MEGQERQEKCERERERRESNGGSAIGTVNVGVSSTTVNVGTTAASTVNIGNASGIVNINKIRLSGNPVLAYYFTSAQTQSIPNITDTIVKWPTLESRSGTGTGITYSTATGIFTNSNSYTVVLSVCACINFAFNAVGNRVFYLEHNVLGRLSVSNIATNTDTPGLNVSSCFIINANETFYFGAYQSSGTALNIAGVATPNRVSLLVM